MQVLTPLQISDWFKRWPDRGDTAVHFDESGLFFTHQEASCIHLAYPQNLEQLPFFARYLATLTYADWDFRGAALWFTEWGVGQDLEEAIGYKTVEAMNRANGQPMAFESAPGHSFRADELTECVGMLLQPMIFGWDAYYVPLWSFGHDEFFLHVSHDSYVTIVIRTKEFYDRVFGKLHELNLSPNASQEKRIARFCRQLDNNCR